MGNANNEGVSQMINDPRRIAAVTQTGSVRAGAAIGVRLSKAALKKCVLELGGSGSGLLYSRCRSDGGKSRVAGRQNTVSPRRRQTFIIVEEWHCAGVYRSFAGGCRSIKR